MPIVANTTGVTMPNATATDEQKPAVEATSAFAQQAEQASPGIVREFIQFLSENKKWWLTPIFIVMLLLGLVALFAGGSAAPFIYTLF